MSRPLTNQPTDLPDGPPPPGKPGWLLYVIAAIVLLFILQKVGCGPMQTHDKMEWIDR